MVTNMRYAGCMAHIMHNSVTFGIKQTTEVIEKNRKIATKYHKSYAFKYKGGADQAPPASASSNPRCPHTLGKHQGINWLLS